MDLSVMIQPQTHYIPYRSSSNGIVCIHRPPPPLQETRSPQPTSVFVNPVDLEGEEEEIQRLVFGGVHGRRIKVEKKKEDEMTILPLM
ncbi:hypothetical protein E3N88_16755 [Mikania micrantha]|uniref:Uncharacterized protein n=1 Tax=Mikania micrantha TaxID=192012 RepID=A0A5N6NR60_9ASTR|nr:hypothetical protein E3N88_16755 [Mikania micrantha]